MTTNPNTLKVGDRVRLTREGTVTRAAYVDRFGRQRIHMRLDNDLIASPSLSEKDVLELVERPLPAEPPLGSIVLAANGVAYQRCASLPGVTGWQPTSRSCLSRTWRELNNHDALAPITVIHEAKPDA